MRRPIVALALAGVTALTAGASVQSAGSAVTGAFVRVNQLGYPGSAMKRAYLMSSADETGATFSLRNARGATVYTAPIGASLGAWSRDYSFVYPLDFDGVSASGTYTISVSGPLAASSPTFAIDTGQNVYRSALANSLFFYQTERDGPGYIPNRPAKRARSPQRSNRDDVRDAERELGGAV